VTIVPHDDPFTPADERPDPSSESPGARPGIPRSRPVPERHLPPSSEAARLRVGVRPLPPDQWVSEVDEDWPRVLAMKADLLARRRDEVAACDVATVRCEEACEEAARAVAHSVGVDVAGTGFEAFVAVARVVADDLCILVPDADGLVRLRAAVLCAPNRWRLAEKLGATLAGIHAPVARYTEDIASPVDAVMARMSPDRPLWRTNWGIADHPALFQPDTPPATPGMDPRDLWLRVEWQTLRRLPETGAILFGIRTWVEKLSDFALRDPWLIDNLADLVAKLPDDVAEYKSISPYRDAIFAWLDAR
jgi:hypothetical protein